MKNGFNGPLTEFYTPDLHVNLPQYDGKRWNIIKIALTNIANSGPALKYECFKDNIQSYFTTRTDEALSLTTLEALVNANWYRGKLLSHILPGIAALALELPRSINRPLRYLKKGQESTTTLNQRQCACLLANAFYCTFPRRDSRRYNRINFFRLFHLGTHRAIAKLKCILHYFAQYLKHPSRGAFTIIRHNITCLPEQWMEKPISSAFLARSEGTIEDDGAYDSMTQLDFANEFIGGGVLGYGAVQEEIRFLICPELIVSCLLCEKMADNEAILIKGAERYSNYVGYNDTFEWRYREKEPSPVRDLSGHACNTELLAIDALHFEPNEFHLQFRSQYIQRELLKAYAGFSLRTPTTALKLATGNWGCGAFGGCAELKSLIQLMAASLVVPPRHLYYFTFGNQRLATRLNKITHLLQERKFSVGQLYQMLVSVACSNATLTQKRGSDLLIWLTENIGIVENEQGDDDEGMDLMDDGESEMQE